VRLFSAAPTRAAVVTFLPEVRSAIEITQSVLKTSAAVRGQEVSLRPASSAAWRLAWHHRTSAVQAQCVYVPLFFYSKWVPRTSWIFSHCFPTSPAVWVCVHSVVISWLYRTRDSVTCSLLSCINCLKLCPGGPCSVQQSNTSDGYWNRRRFPRLPLPLHSAHRRCFPNVMRIRVTPCCINSNT